MNFPLHKHKTGEDSQTFLWLSYISLNSANRKQFSTVCFHVGHKRHAFQRIEIQKIITKVRNTRWFLQKSHVVLHSPSCCSVGKTWWVSFFREFWHKNILYIWPLECEIVFKNSSPWKSTCYWNCLSSDCLGNRAECAGKGGPYVSIKPTTPYITHTLYCPL